MAELAALDLLAARGLKLIAQNYRCRFGELDLVLLDRGVLVVVEVRLRGTPSCVGAIVSIDSHKRRSITLAARHLLLARRELRDLPVRFDVVAFNSYAAASGPEWIKGAFEAD